MDLNKLSINNVGEPNSKRTTRVGLAIQAGSLVLAGTSWALANPKVGFYIILGGVIVNIALAFLPNEDKL